MMRKYLLALDGSVITERVLEKTLSVTEGADAKITVMCVASDLGITTSWTDQRLPELVREARLEEAQRIVQRAVDFFESKGVKVDTLIKKGEPASVICSTGKDYNMIIIGSQGYSGVKKMILGSVANEVVQCSDTPVLVVKP